MRYRECGSARATMDICAAVRKSSWLAALISRSCRRVPTTLWFLTTIRSLSMRARARASSSGRQSASASALLWEFPFVPGAGVTTALPGTAASYSSTTLLGSGLGSIATNITILIPSVTIRSIMSSGNTRTMGMKWHTVPMSAMRNAAKNATRNTPETNGAKSAMRNMQERNPTIMTTTIAGTTIMDRKLMETATTATMGPEITETEITAMTTTGAATKATATKTIMATTAITIARAWAQPILCSKYLENQI